jgi:DNA-binding HxlR family transcriptional regulator
MATIALTGALADRDAWTAERCSMAAALGVVGKRATFLLMREAAYGATRFDEFVRRSQLSEAVVAARLRELTDEGLFERVPYRDEGARTRQRYELTDKGRDLLVVLLALMRWGDRWVAQDGGPVTLRHTGCGGRVEVQLRCEHDHEVAPDEVEVATRR